jgi:hypothetical protein
VIQSLRTIIPKGALVGLIAAALFGVSTTVASAKSAKPCWKVLTNDWFDGRIDGTYPIHCYREALQHLPADIEAYSSARDDIKQALQERITQSRKKKDRSGTSSSNPSGSGPSSGGSSSGGPSSGGSSSGGPSSGGPSSGGPSSGGSSSGGPSNEGSQSPDTGNSSSSTTSSGPIGKAFDAGKPSSADSVPVPLIVLGAVALLLMAAGAAGFVARRLRTRKVQLASAGTLPQRASGPPREP